MARPETDAVINLASELAELGREDEGAVEQLRAAAGQRSRVLARALKRSKLGPNAGLLDDRVVDRARRLLTAAATDRPVDLVSSDQEAWFRQIDALEAGGRDAAYARLVARVPGLQVLDREVRARVEAIESSSSDGPVDDEWWDEFCERLERLLGRRAIVTDPVLQSDVAYYIAHGYLGDLAGVLID